MNTPSPATPDPILASLLDIILTSSSTQLQALRKMRILKERLLANLFVKGDNSSDREKSLAISDKQWLDSLDGKFLSQFDHKNISPLFDSAEKEIKKMPVLIVVLPIELPEKEATDLTARLRHDYGKNFLIETKLDHNLIAGPALIWKGIYRDYSMRAQIEAKKTELLQMFKESVKR